MTRRERMINTFEHRSSDIIPHQTGFTTPERERMAEYLNDPDLSKLLNNHISDCVSNGYEYEDPARPGFFTDEFGVVWNRSGPDKDIGVIEGLVIPEADERLIKLPDIDEAQIRAAFDALRDEETDAMKMAGIGFSMFERAWTLRGMENVLADMILEPKFTDALLTAICERNLRIINIALEYNFDAFEFGDDWGQQAGTIMGPKHWQRYIKPHMARMFAPLKAAGKYIVLHSCGDRHELFPDLVDIGLDMYQTFQPEIYDIRKVKKEIGDNLCFWGGISTQRLLPFAAPEEVKEKTIEIMRVMGENGGYLAGPTHAVPQDVPPENILAMLDVFNNQDKYI